VIIIGLNALRVFVRSRLLRYDIRIARSRTGALGSQLDPTMTNVTRSSIASFALAGIALVIAVVTGVELLGRPLRLVNLVTIMGMSMFAGVTWMQAVLRAQGNRFGSDRDSNS